MDSELKVTAPRQGDLITTSIRLPWEMLAALDEVAEANHRKRSDMVRVIMREYLVPRGYKVDGL